MYIIEIDILMLLLTIPNLKKCKSLYISQCLETNDLVLFVSFVRMYISYVHY